jgi:peptidoglycan/LPS O-acetylase OafA/YrhL
LLQLPVQSLVKLLFGSHLGTPERFPIQSFAGLSATLLVAWISWRYFERPLQDVGHKLTTTKSQKSPQSGQCVGQEYVEPL